MKVITGYKCSEHCTTIYNSYNLKNDKDILNIIEEIQQIRILNGCKCRSTRSYFHEIKAHNRLYKLHIFRSHTKDTDLEEPINKWLDIIYFIIGF